MTKVSVRVKLEVVRILEQAAKDAPEIDVAWALRQLVHEVDRMEVL